jgi:rhomboid family GlyGly-CTERM serine protease
VWREKLRGSGLGGWGGAAFLALAVAIVVVAALGEAPRLALRWDRAALAAGQAWRLLSGHFVHLDLQHAVLNVLGLLLIWMLFARAFSRVQWLAIVVAGVAAVDLGLWLVNVELQWYVGASGVLHAAMAAGIVRRMIEHDRIAWVLGVLGIAKLLQEHFTGALPFTTSGAMIVTDAHLYGALAGMICGVFLRPRECRVTTAR